MRGGVKLQIQHEANPNAVFAMRPLPKYCMFFRVISALTDLLLYGEDLEQQHTYIVMNLERDACKISTSLLPQEYKMEYVKSLFDP